MHVSKLLIPILAIFLSSCSNGMTESPNPSVSSNVTESYADSLAPLFSKFQGILDFDFDPKNNWSISGSLQGFRPSNAVIEFDPDYKSLSISTTAFLDDNSEWNAGESVLI